MKMIEDLPEAEYEQQDGIISPASSSRRGNTLAGHRSPPTHPKATGIKKIFTKWVFSLQSGAQFSLLLLLLHHEIETICTWWWQLKQSCLWIISVIRIFLIIFMVNEGN